ncbi:MAG: tyrosine-type recombinase/integrase, partial [Verrucomicrobiota bacterium]
MVAWAQQACRSNRPQQHARRLELISRFARFWAAFDPRTEVPPAGLLGPAYSARPPVHIYTPRQITRLLAMTRHLHWAHPWWTLTFKTLFGLLAATGIRLGEVICLQDRDVDWSAGEMTVRQGKSGRPRHLPLHATTQQALRRYRQARPKCLPGSHPAFFVQPHGQPLKSWQVRDGFRYARQRLGWQAWRPRPRLHDLRHTFAVRCLLRWQGQRLDFGKSQRWAGVLFKGSA